MKTKYEDIIRPDAELLPLEIKNICTPTIFTFSDSRKYNLFADAEVAALAVSIQPEEALKAVPQIGPKILDMEKWVGATVSYRLEDGDGIFKSTTSEIVNY
ncbi:hypothetical protein NPIL_352241 [Nephila pilipes]|uniref:Uncharacterized protein n=1 Tax=Nephila pilipes TaxID=299642 RepID=A0A8X6PXV0_NEPPI|nr:hypothetical protein NPIL_579601 [Nephila pilipes]GFT94790.1 hypothetical protein NPIL_352241 [Nephila pilipes]